MKFLEKYHNILNVWFKWKCHHLKGRLFLSVWPEEQKNVSEANYRKVSKLRNTPGSFVNKNPTILTLEVSQGYSIFLS